MPKRLLQGQVVSSANHQTIVVNVERRVRHPMLGKTIRRSKKFHAHDAENQAKPGDIVRIEECRPISKLKSWKLESILTSASDEA